MTKSRYYKHSGKIGALGPVIILLLGVFTAILLGAVYTYAIFYIPFVYFNVIMTLIFGGVVGFAVGMGGVWGKIRNTNFVVGAGILVGLFAVYVNWVIWLFGGSEFGNLILSPAGIAAKTLLLANHGTFSIFGWQPTGISMYILWGIEASLIVGASTIIAWVMSDTPFCEECNEWVDEDCEEEFLFEPIEEVQKLISQMENNDFTSLISLPPLGSIKPVKSDNPHVIPPKTSSSQHTMLKLSKCKHCTKTVYLSLYQRSVEQDDEGEEKVEEENVVSNLIIGENEYTQIKNAFI